MNKSATRPRHGSLHHNAPWNVVLTICFCLLGRHGVQAGPRNIAPLAQATASSSAGSDYSPANATDGTIHIPDQGEWASGSGMTFWGQINYPWIQL
ncbi:MAG: hypothetical protein JSW27_14175, partial [Phycisphaerales bacterium]